MLQTFPEPTLSYHLSTDFISSSICLHQASFTNPFKFLILANFFFFSFCAIIICRSCRSGR